MHDPMTVAFEINRPWPNRLKAPRYWPALVTIWHVDPETDGTDDSCGYSYPNNEEEERKLANEMLEWEKKFPYYFVQGQYDASRNGKYPNLTKVTPGDTMALVLSAFDTISWSLDRRRLNFALTGRALRLGFSDCDSFQHAFTETNPEEQRRVFLCLIRAYRHATRPWWKHPKWHFWHWQIQVHPVQTLKRWLFSHCCHCGKRFAWGYSPSSNNWDSDGPAWFKSERGVYHHDCSHPESNCCAQSETRT